MSPANMPVVPATEQDAPELAQLIYLSGPSNLKSVFFGHYADMPEATKRQNCIDYLAHALQQSDGQFGFANQRVIRVDQQVIGCVSYWSNPLSDSFRQITLDSLVSYFGTLETTLIIKNSQYMSRLVKPPEPNELSLGHLCVAAKYRGQQVAQQLLDYCQRQALKLKKSALALDVVEGNEPALQCYVNFGFRVISTTAPCINGQALGLQPHCHMTKPL